MSARVTFDVDGPTLDEIERRAETRLLRYLGAPADHLLSLDYDIDSEPLIVAGDGEVVTWRARISCVIPR